MSRVIYYNDFSMWLKDVGSFIRNNHELLWSDLPLEHCLGLTCVNDNERYCDREFYIPIASLRQDQTLSDDVKKLFTTYQGKLILLDKFRHGEI